MTLDANTIKQARWSVIWYRAEKGRFVRKRFAEDFGGALAFYTDKKMSENLHDTARYVTLYSDNIGFPPPRRITHHEEDGYEVVTRRGKKFKRKVTRTVNLMKRYNDEGVWWCPFCAQLRRFKFLQTERGSEMCCPVCSASNYIGEVRKHNPKAIIVEMHRPRRTRGRRQR